MISIVEFNNKIFKYIISHGGEILNLFFMKRFKYFYKFRIKVKNMSLKYNLFILETIKRFAMVKNVSFKIILVRKEI